MCKNKNLVLRRIKYLFLIISICCCAILKADTKQLLKELKQAGNDNDKYVILCKLTDEYRQLNEDEKAIYYLFRALDIKKKSGSHAEIALHTKQLGFLYQNIHHQDSSIFFYNKAIELYKNLNDDKNIADCINGIANVMLQSGHYNEAIKYFSNAIRITDSLHLKYPSAENLLGIGIAYNQLGQRATALEKIQNSLRIADAEHYDSLKVNCYIFIGNIFSDEKEGSSKSMEYYRQAEILAKKLNMHERLATIYTYIGNNLYNEKKYKESLQMYFKVLQIAEKQKNTGLIGGMLGNIGNVYSDIGITDSALLYQLKSVEIFKKLGDIQGLTISYTNIGYLFNDLGQPKKALEYYNKSLEYTRELNSLEDYIENYKGLAETHSKLGNYKEAYEFEKLFHQYNDSVFNENNTKKLTEMEMNYQFEAKEKEKAIIQKEKEKRQHILNYAYAAGILLLLVIVAIVYRNSLHRKKTNLQLQYSNTEITKQKEQIEAKNEELHQQTEEILAQRDEIEKQKNLLEHKNKEVTDSIFYARRIQKALLSSEGILKKHCAEYFILNKPKDIVSGDFYWSTWHRERLFVATADCTGHGVPGAFMSMIGVNYLNDIVIKNNLTKPDDILNALRHDIIAALNPEGSKEQSRDGMDMVLCVYNFEKMELEYAAANNPLWMVRDGAITEFKADKQPVGKYIDDNKPFNTQKIALKKGDWFYTFSDGYADQFGGPKEKKFKYKPLQELILKEHNESANEQHQALESAIIKWKGELEQVDDILVVGIKV